MKIALPVNFLRIAMFFLLPAYGWAQGNCNTSIQVTNLSGTPCATSSPQGTNTLTPAPGSCVDGTNDTWFYFVAQVILK
jgi:uncharacterized membrane protein